MNASNLWLTKVCFTSRYLYTSEAMLRQILALSLLFFLTIFLYNKLLKICLKCNCVLNNKISEEGCQHPTYQEDTFLSCYPLPPVLSPLFMPHCFLSLTTAPALHCFIQLPSSTLWMHVVGAAYFGEYPLAFAACNGDFNTYDYLIEHGANPNLQDSFGNTVLHMLVITDNTVLSPAQMCRLHIDTCK